MGKDLSCCLNKIYKNKNAENFVKEKFSAMMIFPQMVIHLSTNLAWCRAT